MIRRDARRAGRTGRGPLDRKLILYVTGLFAVGLGSAGWIWRHGPESNGLATWLLLLLVVMPLGTYLPMAIFTRLHQRWSSWAADAATCAVVLVAAGVPWLAYFSRS